MDGGEDPEVSTQRPLEIRLLGGFSLSLDGEPITTVDAPRLQSLLAYLILHRGARQPRERLAFLFWPDSDEPQARTNLRQALHHLRRAVPHADRYLESGARAVRWRDDVAFSLDVAEFDELLNRAAEAREAGDSNEDRAALGRALALYGGDLVANCYDDWIVPERERLRESFIGATERLADLLEGERDYRRAIPLARRLLDDNPLNEESCRRLMRLFAVTGERAAALRTYHGHATALARETGVAPSAATEEAYQRLLESKAAEPREEGRPAVGASPLVGREEEWEVLRTAWQRATGGEVLLTLIEGEAGIGKSRLCEELGGWVRRQGFRTAGSRCYAAAGGLAYGPVVELLRSDAVAAALRRLPDPWLTELARLLPELLDERPDLAPPLTDEWQQTRLLDALTRAVLAEERPLLLVIDDLQWSDTETLGWLHHVLRSRPQAPLLIAATARAEELTAEHPVQSLRASARSSGQAVELELGALGRADTTALAASVSGRELDDDRKQLVYHETEGNPLFVVEWMRAGLLDEAPPKAAGEEDGATRELPPRVHSVIEARLAQLSPAAQELASLAGAVGREFEFRLLAQASPRADEEVVEGIDELWARRIVRETGVDAYDFTHDRLREAAYLRVGSARRQMLHRRAAQALERLHATDLDSVSNELAAHYERAGWADRAIGFYGRAAKVAKRVYAEEAAIALLSKALELLDAQPETTERDERELALRTALGASLVGIKGYGAPEVRDVYQRALKLCDRLGTRPGPPVLRAVALVDIARGELARAYEFGEQLLRLGEREDDPMVRVEGNYVLGVTSHWLGRLVDARDRLERAIAEYVPERARSHLALYSQDPRIVCLSRLAYLFRYLGKPREAEEKAREALRLAGELEQPFSLAYALNFTAWLAIDMGDEPLARKRAERMAALADEQELGFMKPMGVVLRGWILARDGRTQEGVTLIRDGIDAYTRSGFSTYQPYCLLLLARVCAIAGRADEARATLSEALALAERIGQRALEGELRVLMGELLADAGGQAEAEAQLRAALEVARRQHATAVAQHAEASLARLHALAG